MANVIVFWCTRNVWCARRGLCVIFASVFLTRNRGNRTHWRGWTHRFRRIRSFDLSVFSRISRVVRRQNVHGAAGYSTVHVTPPYVLLSVGTTGAQHLYRVRSSGGVYYITAVAVLRLRVILYFYDVFFPRQSRVEYVSGGEHENAPVFSWKPYYNAATVGAQQLCVSLQDGAVGCTGSSVQVCVCCRPRPGVKHTGCLDILHPNRVRRRRDYRF